MIFFMVEEKMVYASEKHMKRFFAIANSREFF